MRHPHFQLLFLVAVILQSNVLVAQARTDESETIAKIELLGGRIEHEHDAPDGIVIGVDFQGSMSNRFNDKYLHLLTAFSRLQSLNVSGTKVTDLGLESIGELKSLTTLSLAKTRISDAGLAKLGGLHELTTLNLRATEVTDFGMQELSSLKNLNSLNLWDTQITDVGLKEISRFPNLMILNLRGTRITDDGLAHLSKQTNLRTLWLQYTPTTVAGKEKLKEALPNLDIPTPISDARQFDRPMNRSLNRPLKMKLP